MIRTALYQVGKNWAVGARDKSMLLAQEAQQVLAKTSERVSKPKFTFGPKSPAALSKVSATEALSRQNKTFHFGTSKVSKMSFGTPKCDTEYIKHLNAKIPNIAMARKDFFSATGLQLHSPTTEDLRSFVGGLKNIECGVKGKGILACNYPREAVKLALPQKVKHVLIGHGCGATETNNWVFYQNGENILNYINKNIPKGEQVIVLCCETGKQNVTKLGIGTTVSTLLTDIRNPAKIVESGRNEIIGEFVLPPYGNGVVYY